MRTKNFTRFLPLLLCMLFSIGGGNLWAQDFYESFDTNEGKGGNDDNWSGSIATNKISSDNTGWTFANGTGASQCAKFGSSSKLGSATTPAIDMSGDLVLTFKAGAWNGTKEKTTLNISLEGTGSLDKSSIEMTKGAWKEYTINISGAAAGFKIKFEAGEARSNRFFLDEVKIVKDGGTPSLPSPNLAFAEATKTVDVADGAFTNALTNENNVAVVYSSSDEKVATVAADGKVTPLAAGTTKISAAFAGNDKYSAQTVSYELTVTDAANAYTLATIKDAITETEGTYSLKFDNAVVSYVNGKNAYIEDKNGAILFYADHAYQAGDVFNGVAVVKALSYNGTAELTSIDITPTTGGTIPVTAVTTKELTDNYAKYELRRVKVVGATLTKAFSNRNATIEQNGTSVGLFNKDYSKENTTTEEALEAITEGSTVDVIGYPGKYKDAIQLNVWSVDDITVKGEDPATVTFSTNAYDEQSGNYYGTVYSDKAIQLPAGIYGYTLKYNNGKLEQKEIYGDDVIVPAKTAILVESGNKGDYTATIVADDTQAAPTDNDLKGSATDTDVSDQNSYFYILTFSRENGVKTLGFYWQVEGGHAVTTKAGKAYLQLPAEASLSAVKGFGIGKGSATGIEGINAGSNKAATVYTISGLKVNASVNKLPKGIYIVNGKKVMVK